MLPLSAVALLFFAILIDGYTFPLTGSWVLTDSNISLPFTLNSTGTDVYSLLYNSGNIPNPLSGYGDTELRYISYRNWTFLHKFYIILPPTHQPISLEFDGLDTYCCVYLNIRLLFCNDNSFTRVTVPIDSVLRDGWNLLELSFKPTPLIAKLVYQELSPNPPPPKCWPSIFHGECYINAVRTTQASFGWDWGPAFPIQGFWKPPLLRFHDVWLGDGLRFFPVLNGSQWKAAVSVEVLTSGTNKNPQNICLTVKLGGGLMDHWLERCFTPTDKENDAWIDLPISESVVVKPWWPLGVKTGPHMYALMVQLRTTSRLGFPVDSKSFWVGFRQVELVQDPVRIDQIDYGRSFYFRINGEPIFVHGSNWIPSRPFADPRQGLPDAELLHAAAGAGIQMLRVWGGGRYESRRFYDLAGHLGIMIWQDAMFACAMYKKPTQGSDSAEIEVHQQIRRLHHHPAIVVWATNNEVEVAAAQGWYGPGFDKREYRKRFLDSIANITKQCEAPPASYDGYIPRTVLNSSPGNGDASRDPNGIESNPQDPMAGDVHFYSYNSDLWDECTYPVTRFTSEYGIMSFPSPLSWFRSMSNSTRRADDWSIRGKLMIHRLHKSDGIDILEKYIKTKFGKPRTARNDEEAYVIWVYLTQLYQSIAYKTHINLLERHRCSILQRRETEDCSGLLTGQGLSMGHLYWQLNDIWAAPTWSTIDASGQWKIAHYHAVRGTASSTHPIGRIIISVLQGRRSVLVSWVPPLNELRDRIINIRVYCSPIDSFEEISTTLFVSNGSIGSWKANGCPKVLATFSLNWMLSKCPTGVVSSTIQNSDHQTIDTSLLLPPKDIKDLWPSTAGNAQIYSVKQVNIVPKDVPRPPFALGQVFEMKVRSLTPELFVWLVLAPRIPTDGWFSINAFHMLTNRDATVYFFVKGSDPLFEEDLRKSIAIHSLASVTRRQISEATERP